MIQLLQNCTIHGVGHIVSATNKIWRCFWYLLLFCGIIGIFVNIVFVFMKYFSHPLTLSYNPEFESFRWPEVTICYPKNPFILKENSPELEYWRRMLDRIAPKLPNKASSQYMPKDIVIKAHTLISSDRGKLISNWSFKNVLEIRYQEADRKSNIFVEDKLKVLNYREKFQKYLSTQLIFIGYQVPCFTIHLDKERSLDPKFIEAIHFDVKLSDRKHEMFNSTRIPRSLHLFITNHDHIPRGKNEIVLYPGTTTTLTLSLSRHQYNKDCRENNFTVELYDAKLQETRTMEGGFEDCVDVDRQKAIVKKCNCYIPDLPIYKNESGFPRICRNMTIFSAKELKEKIKCAYLTKGETFTNFRRKGSISCRQYREKKCNSLSYKVNKVTDIDIELMKSELEDKIRKYANISESNVKYKTTVGHVSHNDITFVLKRESIFGDRIKEENEYPFSQLLSDVGGLMGLWLGMSVVGLFEIGAMAYRYLINKVKNIRNKNDEPTSL